MSSCKTPDPLSHGVSEIPWGCSPVFIPTTFVVLHWIFTLLVCCLARHSSFVLEATHSLKEAEALALMEDAAHHSSSGAS